MTSSPNSARSKLHHYKEQISRAVLCIVMLAVVNSTFAASVFAGDQRSVIYYFGQGCSHCAKVDDFLTKNNYYETYAIVKKEVYFDTNNANEMNAMFDRLTIPIAKRGVPTIGINNQTMLTGDRDIIANLISSIEGITPTPQKDASYTQATLTIPLVVGAALVDAVNPCEFAVLIILLSTMTIVKKDKTALKGGLLFSLAVFLSYFLMGLGIYKVLSTAAFPLILMKGIGIVALLLGLWNLKDFVAYQKWLPPVEVPFSWRPAMKAIIRRVTSPAGAFVVGLVISAFLLPCTSGPYLIILSMLSQKETFSHAVWYLLLYNLIFISPMVAITLLVYKGLDPEAAEAVRQKNLRRLHLIAGILLVLMSLYILFIY